jgi:glycosyltransferase involved in cell wall biosynthesis
MPRTYLAAVGDVNDPITWSGIPYHFLQSAQAGGLIDEGLPLDASGPVWQRRRLLWNLGRFLTLRGKGGYQYSISFLEHLWKPFRAKLQVQSVINCFQLFPPSVVADRSIRKVFYIDMTLLQLFDFYHQRSTVGHAIAREAVERERRGYEAAEFVVGHSRWAADSVIRDYGIDPTKVRWVIPGANIERELYRSWNAEASQRGRPEADPAAPLKLVFIGKYWDRKGLDRLLEALLIAQQGGVETRLQVIGCQQSDLPTHLQNVPGVEWLGFLDKRRDMRRFLEIVAGADIGCLLSRAEAGGMVLREYHALGLIVLGPDVGGAPEHMFESAGRAFAPTAPAEEIAEWLIHLKQHSDEFRRLRENAWACREEATWDATVARWHAFWRPGL